MEPQADAKCAHCGGAHKITWVRSAWRSKGVAECVECGGEMDRWDATTWPSYRLFQSGEGSD